MSKNINKYLHSGMDKAAGYEHSNKRMRLWKTQGWQHNNKTCNSTNKTN
jgi:hypothetical protein